MFKVVLSANSSWYLFNYKLGLINKLLKNYDVYCISPKDKYTKYLKKIGVKYYNINLNTIGINPFKEFQTIRNLFKILNKIKPDLLLNFTIKNNIYGTVYGYLSKKPYANNTAGLGNVFINKNIIFYLIRKVYNFCLKNSNYIFTQNKDDYDYLIKYLKIHKKKICLIPGAGIKLNIKQKLFKVQKKNEFTFLYLGRFIKNKGIIDLYKAFNNISQINNSAKLVMVGFKYNDNSQISNKFINLIKKNKSIKIINFTHNTKGLIANCDCLVLPSYREGMPKTLLEAGLNKKISIASNVPGCRDVIIDNFNGYLFEAKNSEDLEKKMKKVLSLKKIKLRKMGNNAKRNVIKNFDEKIVITKTLNFIKNYDQSRKTK